jgi:hypothetical protein
LKVYRPSVVASAVLIPGVLLGQVNPSVMKSAEARVPKAHVIAADAELVKAVLAKNASGETSAQIQARDQAWMNNPKEPLRAALSRGACADRLRALAADDAAIAEVILTDANGANVCVSRETSDYWQGDEPKWEKPYKEGVDPFIDTPALDVSTGTYAVQISVPVLERKRRIGAVTLTVKIAVERPAR